MLAEGATGFEYSYKIDDAKHDYHTQMFYSNISHGVLKINQHLVVLRVKSNLH